MYEIGSTVDNYRLLSRLGGGGAGNVYLAQHLESGCRVALKVPHAHHLEDRDLLRRFFREARAINQVRHENVVDIVEFVEREDAAYYAMEFLDGETLDELIDREPDDLTLLDRLRIAGQVSSALTAAHQVGVVHRDLKPANVVILERPFERYFVKLLDFGAALLRPGGQLSLEGSDGVKTMVGHVIGTPGYMSPEALIGDKTDHRTDIYGFGVLMYELIGARQPFDAATVNKLLMKTVSERPKPLAELELPFAVPEELSDLVARCLEKRPEDRPQEMREVGATLVRITNLARPDSTAAIILSKEPTPPAIQALPPEPAALRRSRRRPLLLAALGLSLAGLLAWTLRAPKAVEAEVDRLVAAVARWLPAEPAVADPHAPTASAALPEDVQRSAVVSDAQTPSKRGKRRGRRNRRDRFRLDRDEASFGQAAAEAHEALPQPGAEGSRAAIAGHQAYCKQGMLYARQGGHLLAVRSLERCLELEPNYAPAYRALGAANMALGRKSRAVDAFKRFLQLAPEHPAAAEIRAIVERHAASNGR